MPDEKEEREVVQQVVQPEVTDFRSFLNRHFSKLALCLLVLFALAFVPLEGGRTMISQNQLYVGFGLLLVVFVLIPNLAFFKKKQAKISEVTPVNPLEEIPLLEESFARLGRDVRIDRVESDPFEGEGSGQPEVVHYIGHETLFDGKQVPFSVSQGALTRMPTKFSNQRYIETHTFTAAGTRKRPVEPGPRQQPSPLQATPANVRIVMPQRGGKGKEEEEEEEEAGEE